MVNIGIEKDLDFPKQIVIETTAFCTQRCIHCAHKSLRRKKGNMDTALYRKIIDEVAAVSPNAEVWLAFYGEALILKNKLYEMIRYAKSKGLTYTILNSNAMLLDKEASEGLINSGLDRFIISMDGFSKETYEKIRVGGVYEDVFANALRFADILKSRPERKMIFEIQFSLMDENEHEAEAFRNFWNKKGANVKIRPKASWAGRIESDNLNPSLERTPCQWALNNGAILWDGSFVACAVDCEGEFVAGNVNNSTIKEIWDTTHKNFRQIHLNRRWESLPEICKRCLDWQTTGRKYLKPNERCYC